MLILVLIPFYFIPVVLHAHALIHMYTRQVQGGADLGIMKSISSMSVAARRNLNNLALQFSKHTQADHGSSEERDRLVTDEGVNSNTQ